MRLAERITDLLPDLDAEEFAEVERAVARVGDALETAALASIELRGAISLLTEGKETS